MFVDYEFHALFILFAFILIKVLCNVNYGNSTVTSGSGTVSDNTPKVNLKSLNMTFHCKFQPNGQLCFGPRTSSKYYFDVKVKQCLRFEYGFCNHSYNMFDGRHQCLDACRDDAYEPIPENLTEIIYCRYQPDFGDCNSYHPSWYYDITAKSCRGFSYSGCEGNSNRFPTAMECQDVCGTALA